MQAGKRLRRGCTRASPLQPDLHCMRLSAHVPTHTVRALSTFTVPPRRLQTCIELGGYVQELNNHFGIYTALVRALEAQDAACAAAAAAATPSTHGGGAAAAEAAAGAGGAAQGQHLPGGLGFSAEALLVGRMLRRDFERYGVHLPAVQQDAMAAAMQRAQRLGMAITQAVTDPARLGVLELQGTLAGTVGGWHRQEGAGAAASAAPAAAVLLLCCCCWPAPHGAEEAPFKRLPRSICNFPQERRSACL